MKLEIFVASLLLLVAVASGRSVKSAKGNVTGDKRNTMKVPELVAVSTGDSDVEDDDDEEPKRLVVYFNFEKVNKKKSGIISDKSGYENSGEMAVGGEILKFSDADFTCNQAARLWDSDISLIGETFQAKPRRAITIAAWVKLEEKQGQHSIFDTIGTSHSQGQYHFEVNDGVVRWFHRDCKQKVVFETMAHLIPKNKWTHIAGSYDSKLGKAKLYINGRLANQSIGEGTLSRDWGIRAGIGNHEKHRPLRGSIDEFRIYNYALKGDEIKALVSACQGGGDNGNVNSPVVGSDAGNMAASTSARAIASPSSAVDSGGTEPSGGTSASLTDANADSTHDSAGLSGSVASALGSSSKSDHIHDSSPNGAAQSDLEAATL